MNKNDLVFDVTNINIDLKEEKDERLRKLLYEIGTQGYNKKIRINNTIVHLNFLSEEKLQSEVILKVLG